MLLGIQTRRTYIFLEISKQGSHDLSPENISQIIVSKSWQKQWGKKIHVWNQNIVFWKSPQQSKSPLRQSEKRWKDAIWYFQEIYSSEKEYLLIKRRKKKQKNTKNKKNTEKWGRILKEHNYIKDVRSSYLIPRTFQSKTNNKILTITT